MQSFKRSNTMKPKQGSLLIELLMILVILVIVLGVMISIGGDRVISLLNITPF
jgi:hypothetical protein